MPSPLRRIAHAVLLLAAISCSGSPQLDSSAQQHPSDVSAQPSAGRGDSRAGSPSNDAGDHASAGTAARATDPASRAGSGGPAPDSSPTNAGAADASITRTPPANDAGTNPTDAAADSSTTNPQPTDAAISGSCPALFCDDFEATATLDTSRWETSTTNCSGTSQLSVDTTRAHSGKHSIRVQGDGGYCNHLFFRPLAKAFSIPTPLYARVFVRIANAFGQNHVTWLALHDQREMKDLRLGAQSAILIWNRESDDATLPELSPTGIAASVKLAANEWQCVEFLIDAQAGHAQTLQTWLNGQAITGLTLDSDPTPDIDRQWLRKADWQPQLSDIRFGWESYGNDANTLWFDDVVLGSSRIGCEP